MQCIICNQAVKTGSERFLTVVKGCVCSATCGGIYCMEKKHTQR